MKHTEKRTFLVVLVAAALGARGDDGATQPCPLPCTCTRAKSIECTCSSGEDIVIRRRLLDELQVKSLRVENCCKVALLSPDEEDGAVHERLAIENIRLANLQQLRVENSALAFIDRAKTIIIEDVKRFDIERFWFHDATSVDLFELRNVNVGTIVQSAMSFYFRIDNFNIYNSRIDEIMAGGLLSWRAAHFRIINSTVGLVDDSAVKIVDADKVTMLSNRIGSLRTWSMHLEEVDELEVRHCTFDRIHSHAFRANSSVKYFDFGNNTVRVARKEAFGTLRVTKKVKMVGNRFSAAYRDSLFPNRRTPATDALKLNITNNTFSCDCHMEWMLDDWLYQPLVVNSSCFQPREHAGKSLADVKSFVQYSGQLPCPPPNGAHAFASSNPRLLLLLLVVTVVTFSASRSLGS